MDSYPNYPPNIADVIIMVYVLYIKTWPLMLCLMSNNIKNCLGAK